MRRVSAKQYRAIKWSLFVLLFLPVVSIAVRVGNTGDPVEFLTKESGEFALRLLILTLMVTPLQRASGWNWLVKLRRMIGLYAFFYVLCHFSVYLFLDLQLNFGGIWEDIVKRKYITVGFVAFLLLIPLAATSNDRAIRGLGARRWGRLHKAVYLIVPLGVLHFFWQVRGEDWREPAVYTAIVAILLLLRHPRLAEKIKRR